MANTQVLIRVANQIATVPARGRASIDRLNATDKVSEYNLIGVVEGLEKHPWMFRSQQA